MATPIHLHSVYGCSGATLASLKILIIWPLYSKCLLIPDLESIYTLLRWGCQTEQMKMRRSVKM